ncbi:unnamed protein product [Somion occarium]|uniref:MutL C-terminal dimerisation domain-containing protein n=1 Tax=Somion occarium TaxID=3059160 RepID=A0ABP1CXV8_9APHY
MASSIPTIEHLPLTTQSKLRSAQILTTLSQIVSELVQNSLDANARHIDIGVNCEEWECWVRDDGIGISRDGLTSLSSGLEERRYSTSKAYTAASLDFVSTFGFRGEASAAVVSCLEISSRTSLSRQSWSIILKGNDNLYNGPSLRWRRESPGTVVCIRDAFFNLPIRRLSHPSSQRTLELIRRDIEAYALVFPKVSFTMENTHKSNNLRSDRARILAIPKTTTTLNAFRHIYGRALTEHVEEIAETKGEVKVEGFISLDGGSSKAHQFLYLNRHPLSASDLHRVIEQKFASSSFAKNALDEYGDAYPSALLHSPRKTEKKPIYVLNITVPPSQVDNCLEPAKSAVYLGNGEFIANFLGSVVQSFLVRHGFAAHPTKPAKMRDSVPSSPRKRRKIDIMESPQRPPLQVRASVSSARPETPLIVREDMSEGEDDKLIWTDPHTGSKFVVDKRTGNSYPFKQPSPQDDHHEDDIPKASRMRRTLQTSDTSFDTPDWIRKALSTNQAYALIESRIPSLSLSSSFADQARRDPCHACKDGLTSSQVLSSSQSIRFDKADLRKAQVLGQVDQKFIACVVDIDQEGEDDEQVAENARRTLLLIDQHAADERVRVERFLSELCSGFLHLGFSDAENPGVKQRRLMPPVPVLLTTRDVECITISSDIQDTMRRWGFTFSALGQDHTAVSGAAIGESRDEVASGYGQVLVDGVPNLLGKKLLQGDELRDVIKGFVTHFESCGDADSFVRPTQASSSGTPSWQIAMRWCPKELLELVNSKACRGAIMFNDTLTIEQCEHLILQLSECALPFQCAHGRPSLAPLTSLSTSNVTHRSRHLNDVNWSQY